MTTPRATDALLVGAAKLAVSALVLGTGFRAVSDDDYSRIVIAQRFAEAPSFDPSGTSWLPLPFWTYGGAFSVFGNGLGVARVTALVLGTAASVMVLVAARWLGASRLGALLAALVSSVFPWSAWLGAAALPEAPAAGLVVLGISALSRNDSGRRSVGAAALALACFCRYEAWPIALLFGVLTAVDARQKNSLPLAVPAFVAVLPIALWLAHGTVHHGDALFFWKRVAGYKHALGGASPGVGGAFAPFVSLAEELPLLVVVAMALGLRLQGGASLSPYARGFACSAALVAFLVAGAFGGGTPTHHEARALLPVFYFLAVVLGHAARPFFASRGQSALVVAAAVVLTCRPWALFSPPPDFAHRELELHIGDAARRLGAKALLVNTPDFGYFAVTAAFQGPLASTPMNDHDPRKRTENDPFESLESLRARIATAPGRWLVVTSAHAPPAAVLGTVRARNAGFTLVEPRRARDASPLPFR